MLYNSDLKLPPQVRSHYCLSHRCGELLKTPTDDRRLAFCGPICERAFFAYHCIVCEAPTSKRSKNRAVCGRSKCRHALQRHPERYRLRMAQTAVRGGAPGVGQTAHENAAKSTPKTADKNGRGWVQIAGPTADPAAFLALPDRSPPAHAHAGPVLIKRNSSPVNVIGGYRFPGAPVIDLSPAEEDPQ